MADITIAFNYSHPFFEKAVELRKTESIAEITRQANAAGYELSYRQVSLGLSRAPLNTLAPVVGSLLLRRKYADLEKDFNSFQTMRDLAQEALRKAAEAMEELDSDEDMTMLRRSQLELTRDKWLNTAFSWSERIAKLEVQVSALVNKAPDPTPPPPRINIEEVTNEVMAEFKSKLPAVSAVGLAKQFGGDNVMLPGKRDD